MVNYRYRISSCLFVLTVLVAGSAWAEDIDKTSSGDHGLDAESRLSIEGKLEQSLGVDWNFNLDEDDKESELKVEPSIELGFTYEFNEKMLGFFSLEYAREVEIEEENKDRTYTPSLEIDEAFVQLKGLYSVANVIKKSRLTVGRFNLSDKREWYYDKSLDGLLMSFELVPFDTKFTLSVNREELFGSDLLRHNDFDPVNNFIFVAEHEPFINHDVEFAAYTITRDDRSDRNKSPVFYGLGARGELFNERLTFWTDLGLARGRDRDERIRGYGFDLGATLSLLTDVPTTILLGYAFGSGGGDTDTDFRQSGLQGNADKFGGVSSFKYYGELLDPELSNLHVFTFGIGFRYGSAASLDFVLHQYRQDQALDEMRSSDLDIDPDGINKQIGRELDIVWGFDVTRKLKAEMVLGYFKPGEAFSSDTGYAVIFDAKISYNF